MTKVMLKPKFKIPQKIWHEKVSKAQRSRNAKPRFVEKGITLAIDQSKACVCCVGGEGANSWIGIGIRHPEFCGKMFAPIGVAMPGIDRYRIATFGLAAPRERAIILPRKVAQRSSLSAAL